MASGALDRWRVLLPAAWGGALVTIAAVATPAPFALLPMSEAGRVVARVLAQEAHGSLVLGVLVLLLERRAARQAAAEARGSLLGTGVVLALGTLFCTVLGYFAVQPLMPTARAGLGAFTFAQLHAASAACYAVKLALVAALAWRATRVPAADGQAAGAAVSRASS